MRPDARSRRSEASQAQGSEAAQRIAPGSPFDFAHLADLLLRALRIESPNQTEPFSSTVSSAWFRSPQAGFLPLSIWTGYPVAAHLLSDIAENAVSFSYQPTMDLFTVTIGVSILIYVVIGSYAGRSVKNSMTILSLDGEHLRF